MASFTPATDRQMSFLNSLLSERGITLAALITQLDPTADPESEISKSDCSRLIDIVKSRPRPQVERPAVADLDAGMYKIGQDIYRVKISGAGRPYANKLVVETVHNGEFTDAAMWFEYAPGAIRRITPEHRMTVEECTAFGVLHGSCCVCARTLTDPKSIAKGIGPVCEKRV